MKASQLKEYGSIRCNPDGTHTLVSLDNTLVIDDINIDEIIFNGSYVNLEQNGFKRREKEGKLIKNKGEKTAGTIKDNNQLQFDF